MWPYFLINKIGCAFSACKLRRVEHFRADFVHMFRVEKSREEIYVSQDTIQQGAVL